MKGGIGACLALAIGVSVGLLLPKKHSHQATAPPPVLTSGGPQLEREISPEQASLYEALENAVIVGADGAVTRSRLLPLLVPLSLTQYAAIAWHYEPRHREDVPYAILEVTHKLWSARAPLEYLKSDRAPYITTHQRDVLSALKAITPEEASTHFSALSIQLQSKLWRQDFFQYLLEAAPHEALKLASTKNVRPQLEALAKLHEIDPDKAQEFVLGMAEGSDRRQAEAILAGEKPPERNLFYDKQRPEILQLLADSSEKAAQALTKLPSSRQVEMLAMILPSYLASDREAAVAWAESLESPEARAKARREIALADATKGLDPHQHPPLPGQTTVPPKVASSPEALKEHLQDFPESLHGEIVARFIRSQIHSDPKAAATLALALPPGAHQNRALQGVLENWPGDPAEAAAFFSELPPSPEYLKCLPNLIRAFGDSDAQAAFEWASNLTHEGFRRAALKEAAPYLVNVQDPEKTLTQIQALPAEPARDAALDAMLGAWSRQSYSQAAETALELGRTEALKNLFRYPSVGIDETVEVHQAILDSDNIDLPNQLAITETLVERFAGMDPSRALAWSETLPSGEIQDSAFRRTVSLWAQADAQAASRFVSTYNNEALQDQAAAGLVQGTVEADQEAALQWALTIREDALRERTLSTVVSTWRGRNPEALREALDSTPNLSSQERSKWLGEIR